MTCEDISRCQTLFLRCFTDITLSNSIFNDVLRKIEAIILSDSVLTMLYGNGYYVVLRCKDI